MISSVRRVVTGHDSNGKAIIIMDSDAPNAVERAPGTGATHLWRSFATPADNSGSEDTATGKVALVPPEGGSVFRIVEFAPEGAAPPPAPSAETANALGAHAPEGAALRHAGSHRTDTIDYAVVISGEIDMWLDDEKDDVHLKAGDVIIQRGTNHAWVNRGSEPCRIAFILIDAVPAI